MKEAVTIKKNHEFRRLYNKGKSAAGNGLVIYFRRNNLGRNRLGITVSTKIGNAVVRNRARRRLREVFRLNSGKLKTGYDFVLVARHRAVDMPWLDLNASFLRLVKKLGLLLEDPG